MKTLEEKIDEVLSNQEVIIRMLTDILERKPPNVSDVIEPILANPVIANNQAISSIITTFMNQMGGK